MIHISVIKPVSEHLKEKARERGGHTAYVDAQTSITYGDLEQRTSRLAGALKEMGISPGDRVAIHFPNSVAWIEACLAIVRRGAVVVPIGYDTTDDEALYRLEDSGSTVLISTAERAERMEKFRSQVPTIKTVVLRDLPSSRATHAVKSYESLLAGPVSPDTDQDSDLDAPSFILYTSGTTGKPKGALLTQRGMFWVIAACWIPIAGLGPDDYMVSALPLFFSYAVDLVVLGTLATGAKARVMERFSVGEAMSLLSSGEFTLFPGVPTMFHYLLQRAGDDVPINFGKLRLCISAGAIMPATLNVEFERRAKVPLVDGLGSTETSTMITLNWPGQERIMGSCGPPILAQAVRIVDPKTRLDVPPEDEGELIVRGPNVMPGYHNKPEETAKALVDGWYLTGDLARFDRHGFITITGRLKELIIRGGENIAPAEIEEVALKFPGVEDCAVVAGKHQFLGEVPVLFVVNQPGAQVDSAALKAFCGEHLSAHKVPEAIHYVERIPRTGSGKTLRFELKKLLE
jgi:rifamycin polyketide synthase module 1/2/3